MNFFDIETGALPEELLLGVMPQFSAPSNWKDPEKIAANIAQQRAEFIERAALAPETGRVLAIGLIDDMGQFQLHAHASEDDTLAGFWDDLGYLPHGDTQWAGWNIFGFDLPFLVRRSWILGVTVPPWLRNGRYWDVSFIDLMDCYGLPTGSRTEYISLDKAAGALGVGRKNGNGADFSALWFGTPAERVQAIEYLQNDLALTQRVAKRIGKAT